LLRRIVGYHLERKEHDCLSMLGRYLRCIQCVSGHRGTVRSLLVHSIQKTVRESMCENCCRSTVCQRLCVCMQHLRISMFIGSVQSHQRSSADFDLACTHSVISARNIARYSPSGEPNTAHSHLCIYRYFSLVSLTMHAAYHLQQHSSCQVHDPSVSASIDTLPHSTPH
jgi:hypothetical protein